MNSRNTQGRRWRAFIDLVVLVILAVLAFLAASAFDAFEALHRWSRQHESWEVDEYFTAIAIATIVLAVFSFRRWQDTAYEVRRRRRAEEALRKTHDELDAQVKERTGALWASEEKYRTLLENFGELIQSVDAEGRFVYVNPQWCQTLGYTSEETRQLRFTDVLRPDQVEHCQGVFSSLLQGISVPHVETVFVSKDGREIFVEGTITPTFREGRFVHTQGFFRDVTERKRAEESAERSEERFRVLFEYAPDAYYLNDLTGTFVDGNKAAQEMTGYKKEELIGKNFLRLNLLPPMQILKAAALLRKSVLRRPTGPDELTLNRKDGQQVTVEIRTFPIKIGNQALVLGIARDVTERKRIEQELAASRAQFQGILDGASDAIISIDEKQQITLFNQQAERVFGYQAREVLGQPLTRLLPAQVREKHGGHVEKFAAEGATQRRMGQVLELSGRRKNGEEFPVAVTISKLPLKGTQVLTAIVRDITERKRAEEALRASEERYRRFFEDSPIPLCVQDFSAVKKRLEELRAAGITDWESYFNHNPDEVARCLALVKAVDVNRPMAELFEAPNQESLLGKVGPTFIDESYKSFGEELVAISQGKTKFTAETIGRTLKGGTRNFVVRWSAVPGHEQTLARVILSIIDITERKQAEEEVRRLNQELEQRVVERTGELRESEGRFRGVFEAAAIGVAVGTLDGRSLESNRMLQEMLGYSGEELRRMVFTEFTHPDDVAADREQYKELVAGKFNHYKLEKRYIRKDGQEIWGRLTVSLVRGAEDEPRFTISMVEDITERKRAEEALRESEEQFSAGAEDGSGGAAGGRGGPRLQ